MSKRNGWPLTSGGRTLAKPSKPGGAGGKKYKRSTWYEGPPMVSKPGGKDGETVSTTYQTK